MFRRFLSDEISRADTRDRTRWKLEAAQNLSRHLN